MDRETRNHVLWIALLWVVFSAISEGLVQLWIDHWPTIASLEGEITGEAIFFLLRAVTPIFILIVLIITYSAIRFRVPADDDRPAGAQFTTGWLFVGVWVGLSVVINVIFVFYPGIAGLQALWNAAAADNPLVVEVTGKQWQWNYHYPDQEVSTVDELVVPLGRPVRFEISSADVVHSFWVPAWGIKKAAIPGGTRVMVVTPTEALNTEGDPTLRVQCAQICGAGHSLMRSEVRVVSSAEFEAWVAEQKAPHDEMQMEGMPGMDMGDGAAMPGMDMNGGGEMPGMDMNGRQDESTMPMDDEGAMPGMEMNGGGEMPGMEMNGRQDESTMPMDDDAMPMDGDNMPATDADAATMTMPDGSTMPMDAMPQEDDMPMDDMPMDDTNGTGN